MLFFHKKAITPFVHGVRASIPHLLFSPLFGVCLCVCIITILGPVTDLSLWFPFLRSIAPLLEK